MNPSTREEILMKGISNVLQGNSSGVNFTPSSRTEILLNEILEAVSGGGGGGGGITWYIDHGYAEELRDSNNNFVPSDTFLADIAAGKDVRIKSGRLLYFPTNVSEDTVYCTSTSTLVYDDVNNGYQLTVGDGTIDCSNNNALGLLSARNGFFPDSPGDD